MKNGMFTGWKDVFKFTFEQNVKTKSFKTAIIGISALLFIVFFAINIGVGYYKDSKKPAKDEKNTINEIYILNHTRMDTENLTSFSEYSEFEKDVKITAVSETEDIKTLMEEANNTEAKVMSIEISENTEGGNICFEFLINQSESCSDDMVRKIADEFSDFFDECKFEYADIKDGQILMNLNDSYVESMDIREADKSLGQILIEIFLPMIVVLAMYMLVLMHGQSISKIIVVEKNSKLMETLLISVKPYAVILGKILAMYVVAILEMGVWALSGIAGYLISDKIAGDLFSRYENPVNQIVQMVREDAGQAFSVEAVIICVLAVLIGFLAYCVLAGLITSNITKAEDLANGTSIYQMIVVAGFLLSYMLPLLKSESPLINVLRYVPVTSVFMLPSDILMGNISVAGAVISIVILAVSISVMVVLTGKIYKKKVF